MSAIATATVLTSPPGLQLFLVCCPLLNVSSSAHCTHNDKDHMQSREPESAFGWWRQGDQEFKPLMSYMSPCLKNKQQQQKSRQGKVTGETTLSGLTLQPRWMVLQSLRRDRVVVVVVCVWGGMCHQSLHILGAKGRMS